MRSNGSPEPSKKRKRSGSLDEGTERERASSLVRRSLALLTVIPEVPSASLHPLLNALTAAYGSALSDETLLVTLSRNVLEMEEYWNWELSSEQIRRLSEEEMNIWKDLLPCRHHLRASGIKLHPVNWKSPTIDLKEWEAHIPGEKGTPWEGGVYVLNIEFQSGFPERLPKMRFRPPLFHPNVYPSGTWGYPHRDLIMPVAARQDPHVWKHTKEQEPERFAKLLRSVKAMLHEPDITNPQQSDAYVLAKNDPKGYEAKIRSQAAAWTPDPHTGLVGYKQQPVKEEEA